METTTAPWWMKGNFAPITDELTIDRLPVEGTIPSALQGSYIRNGFNPPGNVPLHWFFGAGMLHGLQFDDGVVSYRNRYVRTPFLERDLDMFGAVADLRYSPANTNIVGHAGRLMALEETHFPWLVDAELDTIGSFDFDGGLTTAMTAHPKICPTTGELLFFGYQFLSEPFLTYYRVDAAGRLVQKEVIDIPQPVMMHDFTITENYAIFLDLSIMYDAATMRFGFDRSAPARVGVLPRNGSASEIRWFEVAPCAVFHVMNSYEDGERIIIQTSRSEGMMEHGLGDISEQGSLHQWTIDLAAGTISETPLDDRPGDFPRIDDRLLGSRARYGYLAQLLVGPSPDFGPEVYRYDLERGAVEVHDLGGVGTHAFEPVFVPAGSDSGEDEGFVLVLSHDDATTTTRLNVIDTTDFSGPPVARVTLPRRIPFGAHGNWFPA